MSFNVLFDLTAVHDRCSKTRQERLADEFFKSSVSSKAPSNDDTRLPHRSALFGARYGVKPGTTLQMTSSGSGGRSLIAEPIWLVVMHNNDLTPFSNVEQTLIACFDLSPSDAYALMMDARNGGDFGYAVLSQGLTLDAAQKQAAKAVDYASKFEWQNGGVLKFSAQRVVL